MFRGRRQPRTAMSRFVRTARFQFARAVPSARESTNRAGIDANCVPADSVRRRSPVTASDFAREVPLPRPLPARSSRRGESAGAGIWASSNGIALRPRRPHLSRPLPARTSGREENFDRAAERCVAPPSPRAVCGGGPGRGAPAARATSRRRASKPAPHQHSPSSFWGRVGRWCRPGWGRAGPSDARCTFSSRLPTPPQSPAQTRAAARGAPARP